LKVRSKKRRVKRDPWGVPQLGGARRSRRVEAGRVSHMMRRSKKIEKEKGGEVTVTVGAGRRAEKHGHEGGKKCRERRRKTMSEFNSSNLRSDEKSQGEKKEGRRSS